MHALGLAAAGCEGRESVHTMEAANEFTPRMRMWNAYGVYSRRESNSGAAGGDPPT